MTQENSPPPPPPPYDPNASLPPVPPQPVNYETPGGLGGAVETNKDARMWAMIAHLSALVGFVGVPTFVGPLVVWLIKKNEIPFVDNQGKEALNFHLTMLIAAIACIPLVFCFGLGVIVMILIGVAAVVMSIIAAIKANDGIPYRYPMTLRLVT